MRVSYEWLQELVDLPDDPQTLVDEFTRTGTEVEGVERTGAEFDHVVTGQVVSKEPHPNSDHMWLCKVNVGAQNVDKDGNPVPLQIVCGAQNFGQNDKIVVAMIEDEATVKRLGFENGMPVLYPENPDFDPIYAERIDILGKVVGSFRQY